MADPYPAAMPISWVLSLNRSLGDVAPAASCLAEESGPGSAADTALGSIAIMTIASSTGLRSGLIDQL
jgi:hypothetical protein